MIRPPRVLLVLALVCLAIAAPHAEPVPVLRVIDWNVHHDGVGTDGVADLGRIAAWLIPRAPDIVTMNEVSAAAVTDLESRFEAATGIAWYSTHFGDSGGEGEGILTSHPILSATPFRMQDGQRKALQAAIDVSGQTVNVIAAHLQNGDFPLIREGQVGELLAFAAGFAEPRLIAGDINAAPDYQEIQPLFAEYIDGWEHARQQGAATAYPDNPPGLFTRTQWKRIDHILPSAYSGLSSIACDVPDQRDLGNTGVAVTIGTTDDKGVRPSDHNLLFCTLSMGPRPASGDTTPPSVAFASPASDAPIAYVVPFVASAADDRGVTKVEFRVDGRLAAVDRWAPYEFAWRTDSAGIGTHMITAAAFDGSGNQRSVARTYAVPDPAGTTTEEIVIYAADAPVRAGAWTVVPDADAAGGQRLENPDAGLPKLDAPLPLPADYVELTFPAEAGRPYHLWLRGRAGGNAVSNDSVYVQYSDSVSDTGTPLWQIGTSSAQTVVLEDYSGAGLSAWGWQDNGYGAQVLGPAVYFGTTGVHTIRIQPREDGLSLDQIVLSAAHYANTAPGGTKNDHTIMIRSVPQPATMPTPGPAPNLSPEVTLTAPSNRASLAEGTDVAIAAGAVDRDGFVVRVSFYAGKKLIGTDSASPFAIVWPDVAVGTYSLTAQATDNAGATTTSASVSVQVKKAPKKGH